MVRSAKRSAVPRSTESRRGDGGGGESGGGREGGGEGNAGGGDGGGGHAPPSASASESVALCARWETRASRSSIAVRCAGPRGGCSHSLTVGTIPAGTWIVTGSVKDGDFGKAPELCLSLASK